MSLIIEDNEFSQKIVPKTIINFIHKLTKQQNIIHRETTEALNIKVHLSSRHLHIAYN